MERENHHPSAEFSGLVSSTELNAFKNQLRAYAVFLSFHIRERKQSGNQIVEDLPDLEDLLDELTQTFHIQCQLLQLVQWLYQNGHISREGVEDVVQTLSTIIRGLVVEPPTPRTTEIMADAHEWLSMLDSDFPKQVVFAYSVSRHLSDHDHFLWAHPERHGVACLRWNWESY